MFSQSDLELLLKAQDDLKSLAQILESQSEELSGDFQQGWMFANLSSSCEKIISGLRTIFPAGGELLEAPNFPEECPTESQELIELFYDIDNYLSDIFKLIADSEAINPEKPEDFEKAIEKLILKE